MSLPDNFVELEHSIVLGFQRQSHRTFLCSKAVVVVVLMASGECIGGIQVEYSSLHSGLQRQLESRSGGGTHTASL